MQDSWPSVEPEGQRASPLPRVEDLPVVERGYDPERVREAFDAFYRHLARLDATLRTIEAVEVFRDQAAELRKELRALRTAGWTQQPWPPSYSTREPIRPGLPDTVVRWAVEACFVIAAPVAASAAGLSRLWIILVTTGAVAIVAVAEWVASLEHPFVPAREPAPSVEEEEEEAAEDEPPPAPEHAEVAAGDATEWTLPPRTAQPEEAQKEQEELTAVGESAEAPEPVAEAEAAPEPEDEEPGATPVAEEPELEPAPEDERQRRSFWPWRRRGDGDEEDAEPDDGRPRHVRVLPADGETGLGAAIDPWEEELDLEIDVEPEPTPRGSGSG